jgi:arsenite methyltransferase
MTDEKTQAETLPQLDASSLVDGERLEAEVKDMYRHVAREEEAELHFEVGRRLAEHLGYSPPLLDAIPAEAVASFAGVGHHLDLAALQPGEAVLDLGSGSGTDIFCSAVLVGDSGRVVGVDITDAQLEKAARLRDRDGLSQVELVESRIEALPFDDATFDVVISNGVINLSLLKGKVFAEAARVLRPGGRLAIADIVSGRALKERTRRNVELCCVHRGRDPAQQLHGGDRGAGPAGQGGPAERVPVHLRAGAGRLQHLRGREHLAAGREAGLAWRRISGPGARAAGFARVAEWRVPACMDVAGPP